MKSWLGVAASLWLCGCSATGSVGAGALSNILGAAQTGGSLTPLENLAYQYIVQRFQDDHNLLIALQQINQAPGAVSVTMTPPQVVQTGPTVVMPTAPVTVVPTVPVVMAPAPVPTPTPVPVP